MARAGQVIDIPQFDMRLEFRATGRETGGEYFEFEFRGRPRGFLTQAHLHSAYAERIEVLDGAQKVSLPGGDHVLRPGDAIDVPPGTVHRQTLAAPGVLHVRQRLQPAGRAEEFFERLVELARSGRINRFGYPTPVATAELVRDFADEGRAARPSLRTQRVLADALLRATSDEYAFADEWDVRAPRSAVFATVSDARTFPEWWRPVFIDVDAEGPPEVGKESRQHFKGRLPYHLRTRSRIVRLEPPALVEAAFEGDLRGAGRWTLTETAGGTHVRFEWQVHADRPLLRTLSPVLRPAFRWNHAWSIARAQEGLEPYARRRDGHP